MRFQFASVFYFALLSTGAMSYRTCGTQEPSAELLATGARLAAEAQKNPSIQAEAAARALVVDTYFHVVSSGSSEAQGNVPEAKLIEQLEVMNEDYASSGISFNLLGITRTVNSQWAQDLDEVAMKRSLRRGDYKTLNVYFQQLSGGLLGYCYFPVSNPSSSELNLDGCSVLYSSVPRGSTTNYNLGRTATHEIGHWFGLFHTFQGGCSTTGDQVADTPAERTATNGCPANKDTCTGSQWPGVDPIHNYMDYSYDPCMTEFTPGQGVRMLQMWDEYRA